MRAAISVFVIVALGASPALATKRQRRFAMSAGHRPTPPSATPLVAPQLEPVAQPSLPAPGLRLDAPAPVSVRPRSWGLFAGGMTLFLVGWGTDIGMSYGLGVDRAALSFLPVFGPLAQLGTSYSVVAPSQTGNTAVDGPANQRIDSVNHAVQTGAYVVLSLDCALQLAGAVMAVWGALPNRRGAAERAPAGSGRIAFTPGGPGRTMLSVAF